MKTSIILLAVVSLVSAQNLAGEPACAIPCLQTAIASSGCAAADQACQCGSGQAAIQQAATPCLLSSCNGTDLQLAASIGLGLCSSYSASIASANATASITLSSSSAVITGFTNSTATSTRTTGSTGGASSTGVSSTGSTGGAAATLVAGLGSVMVVLGGAVALL